MGFGLGAWWLDLGIGFRIRGLVVEIWRKGLEFRDEGREGFTVQG